MQVLLIEEGNHSIAQYVVGVQEPYMIVTLGARDEARQFSFDDAEDVIARIKRATNGHRVFRVEIP